MENFLYQVFRFHSNIFPTKTGYKRTHNANNTSRYVEHEEIIRHRVYSADCYVFYRKMWFEPKFIMTYSRQCQCSSPPFANKVKKNYLKTIFHSYLNISKQWIVMIIRTQRINWRWTNSAYTENVVTLYKRGRIERGMIFSRS